MTVTHSRKLLAKKIQHKLKKNQLNKTDKAEELNLLMLTVAIRV